MIENPLTTDMCIQEDVLRLRLENEQLKQEKCELLGIIQKKDEIISKLAKELEHLKAQIMKMRGCINCTHFQEYNGNTDDYVACELEKCENLENWEFRS